MFNSRFGLLIFIILGLLCFQANCIDLNQLFASMSIEDKCGQMTQLTAEILAQTSIPGDVNDNPMNETLVREAVVTRGVGSINGHPFGIALPQGTWQKMISVVQDYATKESKLKIPIVYVSNSIHGANYVQEGVLFPQPLAQAATFNLEFAQRIGEIASIETRAVGITWNNNPILDMGRQPLWSR
jgi:beta-glucosidase